MISGMMEVDRWRGYHWRVHSLEDYYFLCYSPCSKQHLLWLRQGFSWQISNDQWLPRQHISDGLCSKMWGESTQVTNVSGDGLGWPDGVLKIGPLSALHWFGKELLRRISGNGQPLLQRWLARFSSWWRRWSSGCEDTTDDSLCSPHIDWQSSSTVSYKGNSPVATGFDGGCSWPDYVGGTPGPVS